MRVSNWKKLLKKQVRDLFYFILPGITFVQGFLRCFRDPIQVPRIENRVLGIRENYHWVPKIREIGSLQVRTGYLIFSLKKTCLSHNIDLCLNN